MTDEQKPTIEDLKDTLTGLAAFRADHALADRALKILQADFDEEHKDLIKHRKDVADARAVAEASVREMQLSQPHWLVDGLEVVDGKEVHAYSDDYAVEWCFFHNHGAFLKLGDRKSFEKVAILCGDLTVEKTLKVRISTDLTQYLETQHE